jgi:hypothetical protein
VPKRSLKSFIDDTDETVFFVPIFLVSFSVLAYLSFRQASFDVHSDDARCGFDIRSRTTSCF